MEWPCLPRSSRKCPVQSLLCPPPHSNLCDLPLHISHRPQPRRHAPDANEPRSTVAKTRELWCRSCPSPSLHWSLEKRPLRPRQLASNPFSSLDHPLSLHTRLQLFLTSSFLLSNPSLCPSTCLLSLPGRATASRPTPAVNKIKDTWRTPPRGRARGALDLTYGQQRRLIGRCAAGITYCATEPRWSPLRPRMQSWHRGGRVEQTGYSASRVARY